MELSSQTTELVERNIQALLERRQAQERALPIQERVAARITGFAGSMTFVCLHLAVYGGWIIVNAGLVPAVATFDPSFVTLAMIASVEAIFLSTRLDELKQDVRPETVLEVIERREEDAQERP